MKIRFSYIIGLSAAFIAGCAAYYSVFGLSQLFAGASMAVIIMATSLEVSKIVSVSLLQRYWNKLSTSLKFYLCIGVFVLVCITSGGIYGFLSNAYQKTAYKLEISDGQIGLLEGKKQIFEKNITDNQNIINTKTQRLQQLTGLRTTQENRLDSERSSANRNRARSDISAANKEIQKLNSEIDTLNKRNTGISDSVNFYANKILEAKSSNDVSAEVGPLKYLSALTGHPMDRVVNWFILLLIFVFDPLAVALVIAANRISQLEKGESDEPLEEKKNKNYISEKLKIFQNKLKNIKNRNYFSIIAKKKENIFQEPIIEEVKTEVVQPIEIVENKEIKHKKEPVITTGKIELNDIKEIKEATNRGFSVNIPDPKESTLKRIGTNKFLKDDDRGKVFFKKNRS